MLDGKGEGEISGLFREPFWERETGTSAEGWEACNRWVRTSAEGLPYPATCTLSICLVSLGMYLPSDEFHGSVALLPAQNMCVVNKDA